jgi:[acyl-carrier-protein] S-malonyltransferase
MKPAAEKLAKVLDTISYGDMISPVVSNVEATANGDKGRVRDLLVSQVCAPVLWEQSVVAMTALGVSKFVELGPGKVLSGLVKRISKEVEIGNIEDCAGIKAASI